MLSENVGESLRFVSGYKNGPDSLVVIYGTGDDPNSCCDSSANCDCPKPKNAILNLVEELAPRLPFPPLPCSISNSASAPQSCQPMLFSQFFSQNRTFSSPIYHLSNRLFSAPSLPLLSHLREKYGFIPPPSLFLQNPDPNSTEKPVKKKRKKPPNRPPSPLDLTHREPVCSDLPFDFRFSYTESNPNVRPIGLRGPKYSPFGPGRVDRVWTGLSAPAMEPTLKSVDGDGMEEDEDLEKKRKEIREKMLGEPLSLAEKAYLVQKCQKISTKRQINLGRDGLTHNMLSDIHNNWKNCEAVRIKCLGVPTVDMENVCTQLEDKSGGVIIHRRGGQIILYRGRYYDPKKRPVIPLMLWKPHEPVYPRLIKTTIEGLTVEETKEIRKRGLAVPSLTKLAKNGYYSGLVTLVRDALLADELVRIDCKGLPKSDYKKIGVKLRDLVPCILVSFEREQIVVWRGKNYNSGTNHNREQNSFHLGFQSSGNDVINETVCAN